MTTFKNLLGTVALGVCGVCNAAGVAADLPTWYTFARDVHNEYRWDYKLGSALKDRRGMVIVTMRVVNLRTDVVSYQLLGIDPGSCRRGVGQLHTYDLGGNSLGVNDFVLDGGSVSAELAWMICGEAADLAADAKAVRQ